MLLVREAVLGGLIGYFGGRAVVLVLNRLDLPQGLHAPFVATAAVVIFAVAAVGARLGLPRGLYRRPGGRQPPDPRAQHARHVPRRRDLARADRHVRAARPAGLAEPAAADAPAGAGGRVHADVGRAAGRRVPLPRAVPLHHAREAVHLLGRPARRGRHLPRLDPAAGRAAEGAHLFRRRLRRRAGLAAGAGLDHRAGGAAAAHRAAAHRRRRRGAPSSICRASSSRSWSAIRWSPAALICGAASGRPGPSSTLVVRDERVLTPEEAGDVREGDHVYFLAPPDRAQALDRFFVESRAPARGRPRWSRTSSCRATPRSARWRKSTASRSIPPKAGDQPGRLFRQAAQAARRAPTTSSRSGRWRSWRTP